jgi:Ca2+-transporting ATPase
MVAPVDMNSVTGLSEQEVAIRLKQDGYNELPSGKSRSLLTIAWDIVQDPIFLLL